MKASAVSAASTTSEPPITGMMQPSNEAAVAMPDSAQWVYSVTRQELVRNGDFLIDSGAATSVCQQSLADSLGGKPGGTLNRAQVSHRTSVQDDGQHDDLLAHERRYQRSERLSDRSQEFWTAEIYYLSWTSVRQRQHHHVRSTGGTMLNEFLRQQNRVQPCEWCVSTAGRIRRGG